MKQPTLKDKYEYLCSLFELKDLDYHEQDGYLVPKKVKVYFQFSTNGVCRDVATDKAVESILLNKSNL